MKPCQLQRKMEHLHLTCRQAIAADMAVVLCFGASIVGVAIVAYHFLHWLKS